MFIVALLTGCGDRSSSVLFRSPSFTVYGDRVVQGKNLAEVTDSNRMVSDYRSPANDFFNPLVSFKLSINGKDNEAPPGNDHRVLLQPVGGDLIIVRVIFGERDSTVAETPATKPLPANTSVRFEADMRKVLKQFSEKGFYTDYAGNRLFRDDFRGLWIAGGTAPLSWDFENLPGKDEFRLTDVDGDGIYTCDIVFNAYDPGKFTSGERSLAAGPSRYPLLKSPYPLIDFMHRMSLQEMVMDIRSDSTFMAGKEWSGVWTRDISYSIILSLAALEPGIARNSLMRKVSNGMIIQDTGSGGSWPVSTDRQVWSIAAWEIFLVTGDREWLREAYDIIARSVESDMKVAFNKETGLFYGESSFLDWRKQSYPLWMEPVDIYRSHNLGTNALFFRTLSILAMMGRELGEADSYEPLAQALRDSMNASMWIEGEGYYGQYLYGHYNYSLSPRSESLGEALCLLFGVADSARSERILESVPVMEYGIPCFYPQIPGIPPYHNNAVWPFVQAYWTWAGAKYGNRAVVEHGIASVYRQAALFLTNKENMVAGNGDFNGTQINSDYQLWSVAGNLAMVYRVLYGMEFSADRLTFSPFVPESFRGRYELSDFRYRNARLRIIMEGYGDGVTAVEIDGSPVREAVVPSTLVGDHTVRLVLNNRIRGGKLNMEAGYFSPDTPVAVADSGTVRWNPVENAVSYIVTRNGVQADTLPGISYSIPGEKPGEYQVMAVDSRGVTSFLSKPVMCGMLDGIIIIEAEDYSMERLSDASGFSGTGYVMMRREGPSLNFSVESPAESDYYVEFRYSNGNGPVNTDNKCAQRSLFCNGVYAATAVFPQRGTDEWSDWGLSNPVRVRLVKGLNHLELRYMEYNASMNVVVNDFLLDQVRLVLVESVR